MLTIISSPLEATVLLDDQPMGTTPLTVKEVIEGKHRLSMKKDNLEWEGTVEVVGDKITTVRQPLSVPKLRRVSPEAKPQEDNQPSPMVKENAPSGTIKAGEDLEKRTQPYWVDPASGLTWENPPSEEERDRHSATAYCQNLDLGGFKDWRLPTIDELRTLIRGCPATQDGGTCNVEEENCKSISCRDMSCRGCPRIEVPANKCFWPKVIEGECINYRSSTKLSTYGRLYWFVDFYLGEVFFERLPGDHNVRCVR